jgi:hypothetical protein
LKSIRTPGPSVLPNVECASNKDLATVIAKPVKLVL